MPDRPPPTFPYNKLSDADTKLVLERASAQDAAARSERRQTAETNRALNDAVKAQQTALMAAAGGSGVTSTPGAGGSGTSASAGVNATPGSASATKSWYERDREAVRKSATPGAPHTHTVPTSVPHHHHHHHHHHPTPQPAAKPASDAYSASTPAVSSSTSARPVGTPVTASASAGGNARPAYAGTYTPGVWSGASVNSAASPYSRPTQPPSPTTSRSLATPGGGVAQPSVSPQPAPGSARPEVPMFGGTRNLPSPFEGTRERSASITDNPAAAHHRTGSTSSARPGSMSSNPAARSPTAPTATTAPSPAPRPATTQSPLEPKREPASASATPAGGVPRSYPYSGASMYGAFPSYMYGGSSAAASGLSAGAGGSYTPSYANKAAQEVREKQEREQREREDRIQVERSQAERDRQKREADTRRRQEKEESDRKRRLEEVRQTKLTQAANAKRAAAEKRAAEKAQQQELIKQARNAATSRPGYPQEPASMISQVAPAREPRPYTYKSEPLPHNPPPATSAQAKAQAQAQRDRDYQYTPRDKRLQEEPKRSGTGGGQTSSRKKGRKDDAPAAKVPRVEPQNWPALTETARQFNPPDLRPVEAWIKENSNDKVYHWNYDDLKTIADLGLGQEWVGGKVIANLSPAYLGWEWRLRDEDGWDKADTYSHWEVMRLMDGFVEDIEVMPEDMRWGYSWGSDVFTDDSAIGAMLLHGGWMKWGHSENTYPDTEGIRVGKDGLQVTLRILPPLMRYLSSVENGLRTRAWGNGHDSWSIKIEEVKRIPNYQKFVSAKRGRGNMKARIKDFNASSKAAATETDGVEPTPQFNVDITGKVWYIYDKDMLDGWLLKGRRRSIWRWDLDLDDGINRYTIQAHYQEDNPNFDVDHLTVAIEQWRPPVPMPIISPERGERHPFITGDMYQDHFLERPENGTTPLIEDLRVAECSWTEHGLVVRTHGKEGFLIRVKQYRWVLENEMVHDTFPESEFGDEEPVEQATEWYLLDEKDIGGEDKGAGESMLVD